MAAKVIKTGHAPKEWALVVNDPKQAPVLYSSCTCGDEECFFSATVYEAVNTALEPISYVKSYV